jgi:hypothetical protein
VSCGYRKKISGSILPTAFHYHYSHFVFRRVGLFHCSKLKQTANCRRVQSPLASVSLHEAQNIYSLESRRLTYLNTWLFIILWNKTTWTDAVVIFLRGYVKDSVFLPSQNRDILQRVWAEMVWWLDVCRVTEGGHMEHEVWKKQTWRVSLSICRSHFTFLSAIQVHRLYEMLQGITNNPIQYMQLLARC